MNYMTSFEAQPKPDILEKLKDFSGTEFEQALLPAVEDGNWDSDIFHSSRAEKAVIGEDLIYDWIEERIDKDDFPYTKKEIARMLGVRWQSPNRLALQGKSEQDQEASLRRAWRSPLTEKARSRVLCAWVADHQPEGWDSGDPENMDTEAGPELAQFFGNLHQEIEEEIGDYAREQDIEVPATRVFTALKTPLDDGYNTDCFVEFDGVTFAIDVTTKDGPDDTTRENARKNISNKADYFVTPETVSNPEEVKNAGQSIAKTLIARHQKQMEKETKEQGVFRRSA